MFGILVAINVAIEVMVIVWITLQFTENNCSPWWVVLPQAGPQEEGGRVKTKPVSCSTVGGGTKVKRKSQHLNPEDEDESSDPPAPCKVSKIGFSMSSQMGKKSNPISIKLGATVSVFFINSKVWNSLVFLNKLNCPKLSGLSYNCVIICRFYT